MSSVGDVSPTVTIVVGTAGTFTNDANVNVSAQVNAEIAAVPSTLHIELVFEPGVYGVVTPILLPSDTSVIGNDSTLSPLDISGWSSNTALLANADAYNVGTSVHLNNTNGTSTVLPPGIETVGTGSATAIIDTNISVEGMTFKESGYWVFGTWFTNATNVDVQDNTYIGGADGNAFVNVVGGLVADNIAIGQLNAAYDNWNGPNNITVEDNSTYMSGTPQSGWSVLINSTPTGDVNNPGNAINVGVVDNLFSAYYVGDSSVDADPLESYGFTTEMNITQQGNVTTGLNVPNCGNLYTAGITSGDIIQDDLFTGLNQSLSYSWNLINAISTSAVANSNAQVSGNLILGGVENTNPLFQNIGASPTTTNNAYLDGNVLGTNEFSTSAPDGITSSSGNISWSAGTITGSEVVPSLAIVSPTTLFIATGEQNVSVAPVVNDSSVGDVVSVTLSALFGVLTFPGVTAGIETQTVDGQTELVITGSLSQINYDLADLHYSGSSESLDDSIEITASDAANAAATRYIPVIVSGTTSSVNELTILPAGFMGSLSSESSSQGDAASLSDPMLNGEIAIASQGNNVVDMGSTISVAFLGDGDNLVNGGSQQEYIETGAGSATVSLLNGGDVTVAGGSGPLLVNAATGNDLVESGASTATVNCGSGTDTVVGGLGESTVIGGSGPLLVSTLPQDSGDMTIQLGDGNSTVFALSGNSYITTQPNVPSLIFCGIGQNYIKAAGNDTIYAGAGTTTVDALTGQSGVVIAGSGGLLFSADGPDQSTVFAGSGNLTVMSSSESDVVVSISPSTVTSRAISLSGLGGGVLFSGDLGISSETLNGGVLQVRLSDGTQLNLTDPSGSAVTVAGGQLSVVPDFVYMDASSLLDLENSNVQGPTWSIVGAASGADTINAVLASSISTEGASNVVGLLGDLATVDASGNGDLIAAYGGTNIISLAGADESVLVSSGSSTVYALSTSSAVNVFFFGSGGGTIDFVNQSAMAASITGGANGYSGSVTCFGGTSGGYYQGGSDGNNSLVGGQGSVATTLIGAGTNSFLSVQGSGNNALFAGDGNATLLAGAGTSNNLFVGGGGTDVISSNGAGNQSFFLGDAGSETLYGSTVPGASNNYFIEQTANQGGGSDAIVGFVIGRDAGFINLGVGDASTVKIASVYEVGGSSFLQLSDNTSLKLVGVSLSNAQIVSIVGGTSF